MNELSIFKFDEFPVRVVQVNGEPWFVAADVCKILEINNVSMALSRLDDDEKADINITDTSLNGVTQVRNLLIINESGLYSLILTSRKPEAKRFKKWLTSEVLPQLRKEGRYELKTQDSREPVALADKMMMFMETSQANQLAMKEDLQQIKGEQREIKEQQLAIKKDQSDIKQQLQKQAHIAEKQQQDVKLQQQKTDALFNRVQELHGTLSKLHQADRKLQKQENYHNLHAISQSVAGNLVQVEMNLREEINKDLEKLYSLLEKLFYQEFITRKQLHTILALQKVQGKRPKGYDGESKADLRIAMLLMRTQLGASDQMIADDLNRDNMPTLTGQGEWTALKVKRFLRS